MLRVLALAICLLHIPSHSKAVIFEHGGEKIVKIMELPDTDSFKTSEGDYFDVGAVYKRFRIVWITMWSYDVRWCGYIEGGTQYVPFTYEELKRYTDAASLPLDEDAQLPFWDEWPGKILIAITLIILMIGVYARIAGRRKTVEE